MIASRVTLPTKEEEADVDGAEEVGGIKVLVHLGQSYVSLNLTIAASMAHIIEKWSNSGQEIEKWRIICMIAEEKISLSWVVVSL